MTQDWRPGGPISKDIEEAREKLLARQLEEQAQRRKKWLWWMAVLTVIGTVLTIRACQLLF